ncbi:MAG: CBS domain-containing protein [Polyangiaceae bacterium]|nr:CBS domain-containing protein [Polyangiaceae bacterium]
MPTVREIMRPGAQELPGSALVADALRVMQGAEIGLVVIADDAGRPVGVVSKTDVLSHVAAHGSLEAPLSSIVSRSLLTVAADRPLAAALREMADEGVHHLVVRERDRVVGVLGAWDVVRAVAEGRLELARGDAKIVPSRSGPGT